MLPTGDVGVLTDSGLVALAAADGREIWRARGACCISGHPFFDLAVLWGRDSAAMVELGHGEPRWIIQRNVPIDTFADFRLIPERNLLLGYGGVGSSGYRVVGARGELRERAELKLEGDELPVAIEEREGAVIVLSSHNLVCVGPDGTVRYRRHYSAPGAGLLSKIVGATLLVGTAALATAHGYTPVYGPAPKRVADPRYARALQANRYVHLLTGAKDSAGTKGFSVVRIDKGTGDEVGRIWVNDRSPDYRIDAAAGMLYLIRDKRTVEALRFRSPRDMSP